jgi:hypothetical protein
MENISNSKFIDTYGAKSICLIVGSTLFSGFILNLLALGLPPNIFEIQWRINLLQQVGDRSIILLIAVALIMYGVLENRRLLRQVALACLIVGIISHLSCILVIRDSLVLKEQTIRNISEQATQLQTQLQEAQDSSESGTVTSSEIEQAFQQITGQAELLKQSAQTGITKAGIVGLGNFLIVGFGLIGLGRFGLRRT